MRDEPQGPVMQETESEVDSLEDFPVLGKYANDTSAEDLALGRDIQGLRWSPVGGSRAEHRRLRLLTYRNYTNILQTQSPEYLEYLKELTREAIQPSEMEFFDFVQNARRVESFITHFQLRNLLQATTKHDVYVARGRFVHHHDLMSGVRSTLLDFQGTRLLISTLTVGKGLLAVGGFSGQLAVQRLDDCELLYESSVSDNERAITNTIEVFGSEGEVKILTSNNDAFIRIFDVSNFKKEYQYQCDWPVNYSAVCPSNEKVVALVGDDIIGRLLDRSSNRLICQLIGHKDYSFAAAWNPSKEHELATGNQDLTTRIWDIRSPGKQLEILKGKMGATRSLRYSNDGAFLIMAEPTDLVHVYHVKGNYKSAQEIDIFGEISGAVFSPDGDMLLISVFDELCSSLVQFRRNQLKI